MKQNKSPLLLHRKVYCIVAFTLLTACSENEFTDLTQYISEVKLRPKGSIKPLPEIKMVEPFIFKPDDLRDPFKSIKPIDMASDELTGSKGGSGVKPDTSRRKEELEAFPTESLQMIGTVKDAKSNLWGLVKSADKTVYRVKAGNYMGQNYGKIIRIASDKIELMEIVPDQPGTWREQPMSISLTDDTGSK